MPGEDERGSGGSIDQGALLQDPQRLSLYGQGHPATWGGLWFEGDRLFASFTDPDRHRDAVRALVDRPESIEVVAATHSARHRAKVRRQIEALLHTHHGTWQGIGDTAQRITVNLTAEGLALADRLWQAHGELLDLTVAGHRYPLDDREIAEQPYASVSRQTTPWPPGLTAAVELDQSSLVRGGVVRGRLVLTATTQAVAFTSAQPLHGELVDDEDRRHNDLDGWRAGTGWTWHLQPGEQGSVPFTASTRTARLADGPYVPAGRWRLVLPIPVLPDAPDGMQTPLDQQLIAGPFHIDVQDS